MNSKSIKVAPGEKQKIGKAIERLRAHADRTLAELRAMAQPEASFSTMVSAWLEAFTADLGG